MPTPTPTANVTVATVTTDSWQRTQELLYLIPVIHRRVIEITAKLELLNELAAAKYPKPHTNGLGDLETRL